MTILVAYGSKWNGTAGLADLVADGLRQEGFTVEVLPAREVRGAEGYEAVVVGGGLYAQRWHRDARRFVRAHASELRARPTYLFSSGPLDDSASRRDLPPVAGVRRLMERVGARGHATFGGRLASDATGFPARVMARKFAGDWRDLEQVRAWTAAVAADVRGALTGGA